MSENKYEFHVRKASQHLGRVDTTSDIVRDTHRALSRWHMVAALTTVSEPRLK